MGDIYWRVRSFTRILTSRVMDSGPRHPSFSQQKKPLQEIYGDIKPRAPRPGGEGKFPAGL